MTGARTQSLAKAPALPRRLQVEVTSSCNLSCRMCIVNYRPKQPRTASMDFETFRALAEGLPGLEELVLQGIGEPLLAPDLYRMITWASERGIHTEFNTNATLLTEQAAQRLLSTGLSALHISLDAVTPEIYEFIRGNAIFQTVHENVTRLSQILNQSPGHRLNVSLVMVLMRRNLHEIEGVVRAAAEWQFPEVFVQNLSHDFSDVDGNEFAGIARYVHEEHVDGLPAGEVHAVFERATRAAKENGIHLRLPALESASHPEQLVDGTTVACSWPWEGGYVTREGDVLPCCMVMGEGRIAFGNVHERSYPEIWTSDEFQAFREGLLPGNEAHGVCRGCSMYRGRF